MLCIVLQPLSEGCACEGEEGRKVKGDVRFKLSRKTADGKVRLLVSCYDTMKTDFTCKVEGAVSCTMKSVLDRYDEEKAVAGEVLEKNEDGSFTFGQIRAGSDVFLLEFDF